jgi:hypothetical protein
MDAIGETKAAKAIELAQLMLRVARILDVEVPFRTVANIPLVVFGCEDLPQRN